MDYVKPIKRRPVFKGQIVGPNGIDFYRRSEFNLPDGFVCWCHLCGYAPNNKTMKIAIDNFDLADIQEKDIKIDERGNKYIELPGLGFRTMEEGQKHFNYFHDYCKQRVL